MGHILIWCRRRGVLPLILARPNFNTGAMLFQLPDVSTNLATITGPNQITFNGITKGQGKNKYFEEGSIAGNPTRGVMDSSAWGFSWKINDGAAEYPMVSDGDGSVWESAQSAPAWAADDTTFNNTLDNVFTRKTLLD